MLAGAAFADAVAARVRLPHRLARARRPGGSRRATVVGVMRGTARAASSGPSGRCSTCCSAPRGIATATRRYVDAVAGTALPHPPHPQDGARASGARHRRGAGRRRRSRHRADLSHEVMVKDNHWQALARERRHPGRRAGRRASGAGSRRSRWRSSRSSSWRRRARPAPPGCWWTIRRRTTLRRWAERARALRPGIEIEATGGITLENVRAYAEAGADFVSVGALTHSVRAADLAIGGLRAGRRV